MLPTRIETLPFASRLLETPNSMPNGRHLTTRTISGVTWQVCGFWAADINEVPTAQGFVSRRLILGKRQLPFGEWQWYPQNGSGGRADIQLTYDGGPNDFHNIVCLEIDADGYVHISYDTRSSPFKYRRSSAALASWTGELTAVQPVLGAGVSVSYLKPLRSPTGKLYITYREGDSGAGGYYFAEYDEATTSWSACAGTGTGGLMLEGRTNVPDVGAYIFGDPVFTSDWDGAGTGFMYVAWTWRETSALDNFDVMIARWDGTNWSQFDGTSQSMPITPANCDVVQVVAQSEVLYNTSDMCLDANDRPHISMLKQNGSGIYNIHDLYYDGAVWQVQQVTEFASNTNNEGVGWHGRPCLICDPATNEIFLYTTHRSKTGIQQWQSDAGDFTTWTETTFFAGDVGRHEPTVDKTIWNESGLVCMWVHKGNQPPATGEHSPRIATRLPKGRTTDFNTSDWSRSHPIAIQSGQVGTGGVTGYTVTLTRANFQDEVFFGASASQADGGDVRFFSDSDLTTPIACQIISWGRDSSLGADDAPVEVRVGPLTLSDSADTTIYVAYGATGKAQPFVDEALGALAAHDSDFKQMFPMSSGTGNVLDIEDDVFVMKGGLLSSSIAGKVGQAWDFSGAECFGLKRQVIGIANTYSAAAWVNTDAAIGAVEIFGGDGSDPNRGTRFLRTNASGFASSIVFDSSNNILQSGNTVGTSDIRGAGWKRVVSEFSTSGDLIRGIVDGVEEYSVTNTTATHDDELLPWGIGANIDEFDAVSPNINSMFEGAIDQVELHTVARGDAWWTTDFNNTNSPATFAVSAAANDVGTSNTPPTTDAKSFSCVEDSTDNAVPTLTGADADGTVTGFKITALPTNGTLELSNVAVTLNQVITAANAGNLTYTPNASYTGADSFTYAAIDNESAEDATPATVTITVQAAAANQAPTTDNKSLSVSQDTTDNVVPALSGSDVDGAIASYKITALPSNGTLKVSAVNATLNQIVAAADAVALTYTPNASYTGADSFTYAAIDDDSAEDATPATVSITVRVPSSGGATSGARPIIARLIG